MIDPLARAAGPDLHGVLLQVAYDGTAFQGWATQKEGRTVEDTLRGAIAAFDPRASAPRGTSRTDSGVHAEAQMAAFDASRAIPSRGWVLALNQHLPDDVAVRAARPVEPGFNPRFHARGKRYRYRLVLDRVRDPRLRTQAWRIGWPMDLERLEREAQAIVGEHDFGGFRSAQDPRQATVRTMTRVAVEPLEGRVVSIVIEGNAFLYNMVRILVGTLVDVARGHLAEGTIKKTIASKDRRMAGTTAPAHGLTLEHVDLALPEGTGAAWPP
ncbi:MAG: tRNA pseudouridine synthase [Myxococcaceae bacterium]|nr:tRNA pseudouridine synthase [Myxococcaceae bacterium]